MQLKPPFPVLRLLPATLFTLLATPAALGMGLGEATVRSALGSPLRVEIALRTAPDEALDDQCITLVPATGSGTDITHALGLQARVLQGARRTLLVESQRPVTEPFANLRVRLDCGGTALVRDYALLIDPAPGAASAPLFTLAVPLGGAPAATPPGNPAGAAASATTAAARGKAGADSARRNHGARSAGRDAAHLRLDLGAAGGAVPTAGPINLSALRLDHGFAPPSAVTTDLVAQREQLRELRALLLAEDNPVDRLLSLQNKVSALDAQLRGLQGKPAAPALDGAMAPPVPVIRPAPGAAPTAVLPRLQEGDEETASLALWAAAAVGLGLLGAGALMLVRRARNRPTARFDTAEAALAAALTADPRQNLDEEPGTPTTTGQRLRRGVAEVPGSGRRTVQERRPPAAADSRAAEPAQAAAPGDVSEAARSAYLMARFPEIAAGLIVLDDPDSVVAGARLYVDHGDHDRANEVLEAAIQGPCENDVRPWLALFELHRLRGEVSPYAVLLERFRAHFAASRYIPEILAAGRQLDPGRAEFRAPEGAPVVTVSSEGTYWLNTELDFVPQALAQELHDTLMAELQDDLIRQDGRDGSTGGHAP